MKSQVITILAVVFGFVAVTAQNAPSSPQDAAENDASSKPKESAASGQPVLDRAQALLEADTPEQARDLMLKHLEAHKKNPEYRFLLGMASMETNRPAQAANHFEAALEQDPDLPRVKLELARAYDAIRRYDRSKNEFNEVLEADPPPSVQNNIEQYLSRLDTRKNWRVRLAAGFLYDDNVNAGPDSDTVQLFGIPFEISPDTREQSDGAVTADVSFDHELPLSNHYFVRTNVGLNSVTYFDKSAFNSETASLSTGPNYRNGRFRVGLPIVADYTRLGSERYAWSYGLGARVRYALNRRISFRAGLTGQLNENWQRPAREGNTISARVSSRYRLTPASYVETGYRYRRESTEEEFLDNDLHAVFVAFYTPLPWQFELFARPEIAWNDYDDAQAAFGSARDETRFRLNVNVSREIGFAGIEAALGYTFTDNDSNVGFFEFERNQISFQLSRSF